ncbi:MAG: metalloregulator ArsR/SmtB family transcription factor [Cytophagaceae bacterium]|nr:metalloregulator ArsR/SmtB family transcription factor [Cytophagaceae bacterium]
MNNEHQASNIKHRTARRTATNIAPMTDSKFIEKATAAVGDKHRLSIVNELSEKKEICCLDAQALTGLSQACTSHHLKLLTDSGLVTVRKEGKHHFFSLNRERFQQLSQFFKTLA